jgi:hypothetical protein
LLRYRLLLRSSNLAYRYAAFKIANGFAAFLHLRTTHA